jgi:hypothetical protein
LKKVLKGYLKQTGGAPYNPDFDRLRFSAECVAILSSPVLRREVLDRLAAGNPKDAYPTRPLARVVWERALRDGAIDLDQFCRKGDDDRHYLVPEKFGPWVAARPTSERDRRVTVLVGCAYAILQPDDASAIAAALAQGGAELGAFTGAVGQAPEPADSADPAESAGEPE